MTNKTELMTHIVAGYPSFEENKRVIALMAHAGVSYIEIQIPFSDPIADGPTILNANQHSLENGTKVSHCLELAKYAIEEFPQVKFLFMTYYNILFSFGVEAFIKKCKGLGIYGLIVPDIPPEEDTENFYALSQQHSINPICVISPTTEPERLKNIESASCGFVYCTSRIGITGAGKDPNAHLGSFVQEARNYIHKPIAVGFGIDSPDRAKDIAEFADIVVIGSKAIKIIDENRENWEEPLKEFLEGVQMVLRS